MPNKQPENLKKFTYGHQFEPGKAELSEYLELVVKHAPRRATLVEAIRARFFGSHSGSTGTATSEDNQRKLSMNCFLSLRNYGLLSSSVDDPSLYEPSELTARLLSITNLDAQSQEFARHILINLSGSDLLKAIENVNERGDTPTLMLIISELNEMGYELSRNSIYPSTMRQWLYRAGLLEGQYKVAWDVYYDLTGVDRDFLDALYRLNPQQKYFLISMLELGVTDPTPWPGILKHATATKRLVYDVKAFPTAVLAPLIEMGVVEMNKVTGGRGAKPNQVSLTAKGISEYLLPFLSGIANLVSLDQTELNRSFADVLGDLNDPDKHIKGKALELLTVWLVRLCSLRFTDWRKRDAETGSGEVDVMAASDSFVYSRWQIQCKNTKRVDIDVVAKEVGMMFLTKADVVMIVTTGEFTSGAIQYADRLCAVSRYYVILIDGAHLESIKSEPAGIIQVLDKIARRTFVRKEYGMSKDEAGELLEDLDVDEQVSLLDSETEDA